MAAARQLADAIVAVTHRCNAHCAMCNIWQSKAVDELTPEHMRKLPVSLRTVNLTGGEPFLRTDLADFVREVRQRCPRAIITISTNAYLPDRIVERMAEIRRIDPAVRLAVSLDGIGEAHDRIRGDEGVFERVCTLLDRLPANGFPKENLRLSMTVFRDNLDQVLAVSEFAAARGLEVGIVAAHAAETHLGVDESRFAAMPDGLQEPFGPFQKIAADWLRAWRPKQWLRAHFADHTYRYLAGRRWRFRCRAGDDFFFVQADGTVYSCSVCGKRMGNLAVDDWETIWRGPPADEARQFVRTCPRSCWMICTARSVYRRKAPQVIAWVLWKKLLAHLRCFRLPK